MQLPSHYEAVKVFCCGPFKNQPLQFQISLPQSGFVPGQNIPVSVLVQNESKIPVELVKIELVMMAHFVAQRRTRNQRTVLTKYKTEEGVLRHTNKRFDCALPVPATPPTCMNLCRLIQIMYQIEVEIKVKGWYRNQLLCAPVTIGNVPFVQMPQMINQQPMPSSSPPGAFSNDGMKSVEMHAVSTIDVTDASAPSAPATPWADSIEPPSYESAQFMSSANLNNSEEHTYGPSEFVPRYPVFNVPSPDIPAAEDVNEVFVPPTSSKGTWL